ncbi:MAG: hypothetical protein ABTQ32_18380 [Myxococcaceae bacterium]
MSRARLLVTAALLASAACSTVLDVAPASVPALDPPHLGTKLEQLPRTGAMNTKLVALRGGGALLATVVSRTYDDELRPAVNDPTPRWRRVGRDGALSDVTPPPDNRLGELFPGASPGSAWLVQGRAVLHFVDGAWSSFADPGVALSLLVEGAEGRLFGRGVDQTLWVSNGNAWREVTALLQLPRGAQAIFGPGDARAFHVVTLEPTATTQQVCDRLLTLPTFAVGQPVCRDRAGQNTSVTFASDSFSGSLRDFPVLLGPELWRFVDGAWERGFLNFTPTTVARLLPLPGRADVLMTNAELGALSNLERWSGGALQGLHFVVEWPHFSCDRVVDGGPDDCEQRVVSQVASVAPDADELWVVSVNAVDTYPTAWLERLPLPTAERTCATPCSATQQCFSVASGSPRCVAHPHDVSTNLGPRSGVVLSVATGESSLAQGTFELRAVPSGDVLPAVTSASGVRTFVSLPVRTRVALTVGAIGYASRTFEFESPAEGITADLGEVQLVRGVLLGGAPSLVDGVALAEGMAVPLVADDGGLVVRAVRDASDGGLQVDTLFTLADSTASLFGSPSGRQVVARGERLISLFDTTTARLTTIDGGAASPNRRPMFSRDGARVAVETTGGVTLYAVPDLQTVLSVQAGATLAQLSRDGHALLVKPATGAPQVVTSSGAVDVPAADIAEVTLSGDGTQVYTLSAATKLLTVAPASTPSMTSVVHDAGLAFAPDPDGADALFVVATSAQLRQVRSYVADGGTSSLVAALTGTPFSFPRAGALGVQSSSSELFFPARPGPSRTVPVLPRSVDSRGRLHGDTGTHSFVITETAEAGVNASGPGVYRLDGTRKLNASQLTVSVMSRGVEVGVVRLAPPSAPLTFAPALSVSNPMTTVDWPCALFSLPRRQPTVEPLGGSVTWRTDGADVFCVR